IQPESTSPGPGTTEIELPSGEDGGSEPTSDGSDPFAEAIRLAESAGELTNRATSSQDWAEIAKIWKEAAAQMADVPESDARFQQARERIATYSENGDYARQRVLLLQVESSTKDAP
ncbi:MAG: hypothetical protein F6K16_38225, partial [Symploca sp. SIO2B6]|nr:hypothetical protein [Symploca sp. SIO2B6]